MSKKNARDTSYRLLTLISRLPLPISRMLAGGLSGLINRYELSKTYKTIDLNLRIALPHRTEEEYARIRKTAIRHELTSYFEFFNIWGSSPEKNLKRINQVYGQEHLSTALAQNKGIIVIVPHFGTWEVMNSWLSQHTEMTAMYKPVKNPVADAFVKNARSKDRATLVPTDDSGVRQVFKALRQGGTTCILPDHTPDVGGEMVPYFDIPLKSSLLSAKLLQKTGASALLMYALRNENGKFDIQIQPIDQSWKEFSATQGTAQIVQAIEHLISEHPHHYHWSYKRFSAHPKLHHIYDIPVEQALALVQEVRSEYQQLKGCEPTI